MNIDITFVYLDIYICIVTYFNRIVVTCLCSCIDKYSYAAINGCTMITLYMSKVVACDNLIIVLLDPCNLCAKFIDLVTCACAMSFVYSFFIVCVVKFFNVAAFGFIYMIMRVNGRIGGLWLAEVCTIISRSCHTQPLIDSYISCIEVRSPYVLLTICLTNG